MRAALYIFLLFIPLVSFSQNATLRGTVKDSIGNPIETVNVIAIEQETNNLEAFGITNANGLYQLQLKKEKNYTIKISFLGFKTVEFPILLTDNGVRDVVLEEAPNNLSEVEVTHEMPVTIKGDTIVYNSDSFVSGTEKKLEDVLKKLPGVEVNAEGEIEVEGKKVSKVMVEGKDFFDGDSKLASKNIPANAVDKVEVLRNYNEVSQMRSIANNEDNVALNIKLKEGKKKFWFGEIAAAAGLDERYLTHPKVFYYSPKTSLNVITDLNNIGELPFTSRDYFNFTGGFQNLNRRAGTSFTTSSNNLGISLLQNNRAKEIDTKFGAANFSYAPLKTLDISGFAIYSYSKTYLEETRIRRFTDENDGAPGIEEDALTRTRQNSHLGLAKISSSYKPHTGFQLDYDALLKTSDQAEQTDVLSVTDTDTDTIHEERLQQPVSVNQNANAYYTLDEKNIFALESQYLYQDEDPFYNAIREEQPFAGIIPADNSQSNYNLNQLRRVKTSKIESKIDYYWITNPKSHLNFTLGGTWSRQRFNSAIFQILDDSSRLYFPDETLNNHVTYRFTDVYAGFHYKVISGIFTFNPGFTIHTYQAVNTQLGAAVSDNLFNLAPDMFINLQLKKSENIRFNYSITRSFTDVSRFASGYIFNNYNSLYQGNRDLESALYHNLSLNYFNFNMFNYTNLFASLSYSKRIDDFKSNTLLEGINLINTTVNSNFQDNVFSASGRFERTFGKIKTGAQSNLAYSRLNNTVNLERRISTSLTQNYELSFASRFKKAPNLTAGYNYSINSYNNGGALTTNYTHKPFLKLDAAFLKGCIFTADYNYYHFLSKDNSVDNEYDFLNADLSYQKKDSKWEYSLKATNLLNTTSLNQDSFTDLYTTTSQYRVQPRYVMLGVKYVL